MSAFKKVSDLFTIKYGMSLTLADMKQCKKSDNDSINFVSRTDYNNGISAFVKKIEDIIPNEANTISVALSGSSVLASFYQPESYYSGYHVGVLTPIQRMPPIEMIFYAFCIKSNRYRYGFGRQANKTLKDILVPSDVPKEFSSISMDKLISVTNKSIIDKTIDLNTKQWKYYKLSDLFEIKGSKTTSLLKLGEYDKGRYPYVTTQATNNGVAGFYNFNTDKGNILTVDSAVLGYCSYQPLDFSASDHVEKLIPRFEMSKYIALFLVTIMNTEQYRYNYGRKASQSRMTQISIKLPTKNDKPDFEFMEQYIKSLPYSSSIIN
jgi:hypothetical protein